MSTPATASLVDVLTAIADQLQTVLGPVLDGGQIYPLHVGNPTPPCIDIFPPVGGAPFLVQNAFGVENEEMNVTVRATVSTTDPDAGQELLLDLLDPRGPYSILQALASDQTFAGTVSASAVVNVTGLLPYLLEQGMGSLLGAEWSLRVIL